LSKSLSSKCKIEFHDITSLITNILPIRLLFQKTFPSGLLHAGTLRLSHFLFMHLLLQTPFHPLGKHSRILFDLSIGTTS
jgi:hypothetical protein